MFDQLNNSGSYPCDPSGFGSAMNDEPLTQPTLAYVGLAVVFILGFAGSLVPPQFNRWFPRHNLTGQWYFRLLTGFAAGIVLAVAFCHSIPDAFDNWDSYTGPEPPDGVLAYPWPGFMAMMGIILTYTIEELIMTYFGVAHSHAHGDEAQLSGYGTIANGSGSKETSDLSQPPPSPPSGHDHGHSHDAHGDNKLLTEMWILWAGLSFHSIFVGLALGITGNDFALFSAIVAHQFFEGLALGARVAKLQLKRQLHVILIDLAYALSAPFGIFVGLLARSAILSGSPESVCQYWAAEMAIQALSGGILVYISLVHMIKEELDCLQDQRVHKLLLFIGVLLGALAMAVLAIYA